MFKNVQKCSKILVFIVLLAPNIFAADPVADLNVATFSGSASLSFGVDLDTGKTGFQNSNNVQLTLNLINGGEKSTTGDGVWGEIKVKLDGEIKVSVDSASGTAPTLNSAGVIVDIAKIHFGNAYLGLKSGSFDYGSGFNYPNALNYDDGDQITIILANGNTIVVDLADDPLSGFSDYNQGFILGYANDVFKLEATLNSKSISDPNRPIENITSIELGGSPTETGELDPIDESYQEYSSDGVTGFHGFMQEDGRYTGAWGYILLITFDADNDTFFSGDYVIGSYLELTPTNDLTLGFGGAYLITNSEEEDNEKAGDYGFFAGLDYKLPLTDVYSFNPVVTYRLEGTKRQMIVDQHLNAGLRFGWGKSEDSDSLLNSFFENKLIYNASDESDDDLLPGVSLFTAIHLEEDDVLSHYLPFMLTSYTGDLSGFKAYGLAYVNARGAAKSAQGITEDLLTRTLTNGMQVGLAASYKIKIGDISITPAAGVLARWTSISSTSTKEGAAKTGEAISYLIEAKAEISGILPNISFTVAWEDADYSYYNIPRTGRSSILFNGEFDITVKVAL